MRIQSYKWRGLVFSALALLLTAYGSARVCAAESKAAYERASDTPCLTCLHYDEAGFLRAVDGAVPYDASGRPLAATSPHFLPVMGFTANLLSTLAAQETPYDTIFLVGPNHSGEGLPVIVSDRGWATAYGLIETDKKAVNAILRSPPLAGRAGVDLRRMESDHSLATLTPFIAYYLPGTRVVSVMLSRGCGLAELEELADIIYETSLEKNVFILASVDFSHYLNIAETARRDIQTEAVVTSGDVWAVLGLDNGNLDSPASMALTMLYAKRFPGASAERVEGIIFAESEVVRDIGYSYNVYLFCE